MASRPKIPPIVVADKMRQAARLLIKGSGFAEASRKIGVSRSTFFQWMKQPQWQKIYKETSDQLNQRLDDALAQTVSGKMKLGAEKALDFQLRTLDDPDAATAVKVRISDSLMDRDDRMSKKRQLSVKHGHEILNPEILALAAATAQSILAADEKKTIPASSEQTEVIEADIISEETAV